MNKRIISLVLLAAMLLCFTACGKKNTSDETAAPNASAAPVTDNTSADNQPGTSDETAGTSPEEKSTEEAAKPQTPESTIAPIPEENVTMGVVEGEEVGGLEDEDGAATQQPQQPAQPTVTAPPASSEPLNIDLRTLDYEGYHALSGDQQKQVIEMFGTYDEFMRWYKDVEAEYIAAHPGIEIGGDGVVDAGSIAG